MFRRMIALPALAVGLILSSTALAGEAGLRIVCTVDGKEYGRGEIALNGKVRGDCPRSDIFVPPGQYEITITHDLGDGSLYRGNGQATLREDSVKRLEIGLNKVFTEEFYYGKKDWDGLLKAYPHGKHAAEARRDVQEREEARKKAELNRQDEEDYRTMPPSEYLSAHPRGRFVSEAKKMADQFSVLDRQAGQAFRDCPRSCL